MTGNHLQIIKQLMFRLLPIQVLLAAVGAVNGIVTSFFASNYIGIDAMSAVGLYSPVNMLIGATGTIFAGGCAIICGQYLGQNDHGKLQDVFMLDLGITSLCAVCFTVLLVCAGSLNLTGFFTTNEVLRPIFNRYILGQAIGILPMMIANQLPAFLAMENQGKRTVQASVVFIIVNLILDYVFIQVLRWQEFGLAMASSLGAWIFMAVQAQYFFSEQSLLKISFGHISTGELFRIIAVGFPGAASYLFQTLRGLLVNKMLEIHVGSMGLSAFSAANNLLGIFWAVPAGMLAVSRLLIGISIGEEDRRTLADIMRVMFRRYLPLMFAVDLCIIVCAEPLTSLFFHDPEVPVFRMMADGLRILPLCMPLSIIEMHFACYGQASGKQVYVHTLSFLDGVLCVAGFSYMLIGVMGINGVYTANVLNGIVTTLYIIFYAWFKKKHMPRNMDDLMVIPENFGVPEEDRIDISIHTMEEVVTLSQRIQNFCEEKGIDTKRAYLAGLSMEEMAGNVVDHGFTKDKKNHTIDVRVVYKDDHVLLRIRDDCVPFNPEERRVITEGNDPVKNIGIRMIYRMAQDIRYQNLLGLNVLTIRI
ncbi:MAG: ATP-binding protein [Solobacterium sp.]|nr:ATP-binding protein [Solobacterium sp.]